MKEKSYCRVLSLMAFTLIAGPVIAHPGHDHSHWTSEPLHMMLYAAAAVAAGAGSLWMGKTVYKVANKEREE